MKRLLPIILPTLLLFSSCSGASQPSGDEVLNAMHEKFVASVTEQAKKFNVPLKSVTTTSLNLKTQPFAAIFPGSITANVLMMQTMDITTQQDPKIKVNADISAVASGPASLMTGVAPKAVKEGVPTDPVVNANLSLTGEVRVVDKNVFLSIAKLIVSPPGKKPVTLGKIATDSWYGETFVVLNGIIAEQMRKDGGKPMTIEQFFQQSFHQQNVMIQDFQEDVNTLHMWKATGMLPQKDGMYQVRVEADKAQIEQSLNTLIASFTKNSDPLGLSQSETQTRLEKIKNDIHAGMQEIGGLKGVLKADVASYEFMGFQGDLTDKDGKVLVSIDYLSKRNGDVHLLLETHAEPASTVTVEKQGETFVITSDGKRVVTGTISAKKFTASVLSGDVAVLTADFTIVRSDEQGMDLSGTIVAPSMTSDITVSAFAYDFTNAFKDYSAHLALTANILGTPAIDLSVKTERKEVPAVIVEKPKASKTFESMTADFASFLKALNAK